GPPRQISTGELVTASHDPPVRAAEDGGCANDVPEAANLWESASPDAIHPTLEEWRMVAFDRMSASRLTSQPHRGLPGRQASGKFEGLPWKRGGDSSRVAGLLSSRSVRGGLTG